MIGNLEILPLDQTGLYKSENLHFMNLVITSKKKNVLVKHKVYLSVLQPHPIGDRESKRKEGSLQPDSLISVNPNK